VSFPSRDWFQRLAGFLERDEDFRTHGRWLETRLALRVDQQITVMNFSRGQVLDVSEGLSPHDFMISGTQERWSVLFEAGWGLVRLYRTGILEIRGDPVRLMQNWKALFFVTEGMKHFAAMNVHRAKD
jgi:hypothetical protein